jgi:MFS family permease
VQRDRLQFLVLYFSRFAGGFGFVTLVTLLGKYINVLDPTATTVLGVTVGAGFIIGMYTTGFTLAQTVVVVPLAWAGDRYDKRRVLVGSLALGTVAYAGFILIDPTTEGASLAFIGVRMLQGVAVTGAGLMSLALIGELATPDTRANHIGTSNAARFAASIIGGLSAGIVYDRYGFTPVFLLIVVLVAGAGVAVAAALPADRTRVEGFPFSDLAMNDRIRTIAVFRLQYAVAVTLVRTWVPIYAGVSAASGGLAYGALAVSLTVVSEKFTNMLCQPTMGRLSDRYGRAGFVFVGGGLYGVIALAVPLSPQVGAALSLPSSIPVLGALTPAFLPLVGVSGLLGVADSLREPASMGLFADEGTADGGVAASFGIRELIWRPGSVTAPLLGGWLMTGPGMSWVFYVGGAAAISGATTFAAVLSWSFGVDAFRRW